MQKISVIAPVALTEKFTSAESWRRHVDAHAALRTQAMLESLLKRFDPGAIENFSMVCPDRDYDRLEQQVAGFGADRVAVVRESAFLESCGLNRAALNGFGGWQIQQFIKLAFAKICKTEFYLTMDSDVVQLRAAGICDLFSDRTKALAGIETAEDYNRLYLPEFSSHEFDAKQRYYESSQQVLKYGRPADRAGTFFSETPVVMSRRAVLEMLDHIEAVHAREIVPVLSGLPGWTEYGLYFQFLEMTGLLDELYNLGDCNAVLNLEKSVWQPSDCYRSQRFYDRPHFRSSPMRREGPFAAIQSWIAVEEWLPVKFRELADFYQLLDTWLQPSAAAEDALPAASCSVDSLNPAAFLRILEQVDPSSRLYRRSREVLEDVLEAGGRVPDATPRGEPKFLTIGMATHNDYDGCYFSLQAIRLYHPEILPDVEFLVIDNDPAGLCGKALKALENFVPNYRYLPCGTRKSTAVRDLIFRESSGEFVLCMDSHVFFPAGALARLIEYCRRHPDSNDLLQGPLISDALEPLATHFEPMWSEGMFGRWGMNERGSDIDAPPFEIGMQGLGVFACRHQAWPGLNPRLAGFGGEEGYLHEKIRRAGGRNLCLPFLRWMHRFERPLGVPYRPDWADRIRNYLIIYDELNLDPAPVIEHFEEFVGKEAAGRMVVAARAELDGPFRFFDAIYCINLDKQPERWNAMERRFRKLGIERGVRRFSAADTPLNHHIGCALSHRRILAEAKREQLKTVLVFEDDAQFTPDAAQVLKRSLQEMEGRDWQLLYLGGYRSESSLEKIPGCENLVIPGWIQCTHAIAYHHTVYDAILQAVPDNAVDVALWIRKHTAIDRFYNQCLGASSFLVWPVIATQSTILSAESREFND